MPVLPHDAPRWFHVVLTTYGSWLPGDPRGFRTRHHREHVEGDYKSPPARGLYEGLHQASQRALTSNVVSLTPAERRTVLNAIVERLQESKAVVGAIAVAGQHVHIVVKLPSRNARRIVGDAKRHAWFALRGLGKVGKLWGGSSKCTLIKDRAHQVNAYRYILRHEREGAVVWRFKDGNVK